MYDQGLVNIQMTYIWRGDFFSYLQIIAKAIRRQERGYRLFVLIARFYVLSSLDTYLMQMTQTSPGP